MRYNLQNTLTETINAAEKNHERIIKEKEDDANNEHNRIMAEKNIEMRDVIQNIKTWKLDSIKWNKIIYIK